MAHFQVQNYGAVTSIRLTLKHMAIHTLQSASLSVKQVCFAAFDSVVDMRNSCVADKKVQRYDAVATSGSFQHITVVARSSENAVVVTVQLPVADGVVGVRTYGVVDNQGYVQNAVATCGCM